MKTRIAASVAATFLVAAVAWAHGQHFTQLHITSDAWLATDSGSVGVGNSSPARKLDVTGTARTTGET